MDLNEIWQSHKTFILGVLASAIVFLLAKCTLIGGAEEQAAKLRASIQRSSTSVTSPPPKPRPAGARRAPVGLYAEDAGRALAREAEREEQAFRAYAEAAHFVSRTTWPFRSDVSFVVPKGTPQPSFLCSEAAAALDAFWRAALATRWTGKRFVEHFEKYPKDGATEGQLSRPERFLVALDLADRVLHLAAHHKLTIEVKALDKGSGATRRSSPDEKQLLGAEISVELAVRGSSRHVRLFLSDALGSGGEALARNADGEDRVPIEGQSGANAYFRREGRPWPLQPEAPTSLAFEASSENKDGDVELQLTVVARLLSELPSAPSDDER
ncbi:MAG: hypothetical protein JNM84_04155 [Planctomycetes bacterium]|nr:hypothetical protein [Planctomycetota bacterium]